MKRALWIDGIRGMACLIVALNHFTNIFPSCRLPFAFRNGSMMVYLFCLISYYLAGMSTLKRLEDGQAQSLAKWLVRRYFRIALPIFIVCLAVLAINYFRGFNQLDAVRLMTGSAETNVSYGPEINLLNAIKTAIMAPLKIENDFCYPIWMLSYIFLGDVAVLLFEVVFSNISMGRASVVGVLAAVILYKAFAPVYSLVPLGALAALLASREDPDGQRGVHIVVAIFALLCGLSIEANLFSHLGFGDCRSSECYVLASILIFGSCLVMRPAQHILSAKPLAKMLGRDSMGIYFVHQPIIASIACSLYLTLLGWGFNGIELEGTSLLVFLVLTLCFARVFDIVCDWLTRLVDRTILAVLFDGTCMSPKKGHNILN